MATQKQKLTRALVAGGGGSILAVAVWIGSQILAALYGVTLEPVASWPTPVVAGAVAGGPLLLYALPTLIAAGWRSLRDAGVIAGVRAFLPWGPRK